MPLGRHHRLVVLGTSRVGKTALIEHLIFGNHIVGLGGMETLGDIYEAVIESEHPITEAVQIYDTPGNLFTLEPSKDVLHYDQEHFLSIADGFMLVYDITSRSSFDLAITLKHMIGMRHKETPVVVVGNKYDLDGIRDVDVTVSSQWAKTNGVHLYETSVLDRESLREPFTYITWCMANPGRPLPVQFQTSPFTHSLNRKSFTIPQTRKHHHHPSEEPLIAPTSYSNPPSPELNPQPNPISKDIQIVETASVSESTQFDDHSIRKHSSQLTIKSSSTNFSEQSVESRISARLFPEDATYPRGGLLGLADCMSNRSKDKT